MDSWIFNRIRATSLRRLTVWTLALVVGVLLATSDHRYIANFLRGPYSLAQSDLDSIRNVTSTPRYFAHVKGERVIDTGIRQYTIHSQNGVETSREESGAYTALVFGNRFLVVRTAGGESPVAEGTLTPWPSELDAQLFDSKAMRSLRSQFYPFYLDGRSEERRVGKSVDLGGRRIIKKKKKIINPSQEYQTIVSLNNIKRILMSLVI